MDDLFDEDLKSEISDVLIGIFKFCDKQHHDCVKVSTLILFLKEKAADSEVLPYINDLVEILDKKGIDPLINQKVYEKGMKKWIQKIKQKNLSAESFPPVQKFSANKSYEGKKIGSFNDMMIEERKLSNVPSTYSNDSTETADLSWDSSDCQLRLEELEITNKRLIEENAKLKINLNTTEDQNLLILQENDSIRKQLMKFEKLSEDSRITFKKHEELKANLVETQNCKAILLEKTQYLEKENQSLCATLQEYENKILQLDISLLQIKEDREKLSEELIAQKELLNQINELRTSKEDDLEECVNKSDYMSSVIAELSLANEVLKAQKINAETEVSELKQEINRFSMVPSLNMMSTPLCSSTKIERWPQSLQQELKSDLEYSNCVDEYPVYHHYELSDASLSSNSVASDSTPHPYSTFAFQCRKKFRLKKEEVEKKLEELICTEPIDFEETSMVVEDLNMEIDSLTEKITEFAQGRQGAEKKAQQLLATMKKLKDENTQLQEAREKAMMKFGDLSILSVETESKMHSLMNQLGNAHLMLNNLENERSSDDIVRKTIEVERYDRSSNTCEIFSTSEEVGQLNNLVESLGNVNLESKKKIFEMEQLISAHEEEINEQKQKILLAQEKMHEMESKHLRELRTLYELISRNKIETPIITYDDVKNELTSYLKETKREINKLLGVRESPDGYSHSADCPGDHNLQDSYQSQSDISSATQKILLENSDLKNHKYAQTDIDMLKVNLYFDKFEILERGIEISERDNIVNSMRKELIESCDRRTIEENNNISDFTDLERMQQKSTDVTVGEKSFLASESNVEAFALKENTVLKSSPCLGNSPIQFNSNSPMPLDNDSSVLMVNDKNLSKISFNEAQNELGDCIKNSLNVGFENDCDDSSENNIRRRRHGVSAEPARVSWNALRDSFKVSQQMTENLTKKGDQTSSNVQQNCGGLSDDTESKCSDSVISSVSTHSAFSLPVISVQDEDEISVGSVQTFSHNGKTENSTIENNGSLKVPQLYEPSNLPFLIPSKCQVLVEDEDLEKKYQHVVFSFNSDQFTLQRRLEYQERARDVAERGMDTELEKLRHEIKKLISLKKGTQDYKDALASLNKQCDILQKSAMKISAQSEQHGCYQHEKLMTSSIEIVIAFVEHLKQSISKLNQEVAEYKSRYRDDHFDRSDTSDVEKKTPSQDVIDDGEMDIAKEVEEKTKSNKFSSISKSLLVTKRLKRRNLEMDDPSNKRVSFDTPPVSNIAYLRKRSGNEQELKITTFYPNSFLNSIKKQTSLTILLCLCVTFLFYAVYWFLKNAFEIDIIRFHDIILRYIPHTIVYQKNENS